MSITFKHLIKLNTEGMSRLGSNGIFAPKGAKSCSALTTVTDKSIVDTYSFKNSKKQLTKRIKEVIDRKTGQKTTQVRFYDYIDGMWKSKISGVKELLYNSDRECISVTDWQFYHPKYGKQIKYSKTSPDGEKDNFVKAADYIVDSNGIKIRPVSIPEYLSERRKIGPHKIVDYPWTTRQSITSDSAATDSVEQCTAVGIIGERGISLNHFNPVDLSNRNFAKIKNKLFEQIEKQGKDAKAFMIGSVESDRLSDLQFRRIDHVLSTCQVPHSKFKTGDTILRNRLCGHTYLEDYSPIVKWLGGLSSNGCYTSFYDFPGQHILYRDGELLITNEIIDRALTNGNHDAEKLIKKSFGEIEK